MSEGYIIKNGKGQYLDEYCFWRESHHDSEAYVHPLTKLEEILTHTQEWNNPPELLIKARHNKKTKTTEPLSQEIPIAGLSFQEIQKVLKRS
jgi:hypothetical protein